MRIDRSVLFSVTLFCSFCPSSRKMSATTFTSDKQRGSLPQRREGFDLADRQLRHRSHLNRWQKNGYGGR